MGNVLVLIPSVMVFMPLIQQPRTLVEENIGRPKDIFHPLGTTKAPIPYQLHANGFLHQHLEIKSILILLILNYRHHQAKVKIVLNIINHHNARFDNF